MKETEIARARFGARRAWPGEDDARVGRQPQLLRLGQPAREPEQLLRRQVPVFDKQQYLKPVPGVPQGRHRLEQGLQDMPFLLDIRQQDGENRQVRIVDIGQLCALAAERRQV
jgi:hypothetical protein